jgi:hypothetical protein
MLTLAGVKDWASFMRGTACVTVEGDEERLKFTPQKNLGPREGYEPFSKETFEIPANSSACQIGLALERVFTFCE